MRDIIEGSTMENLTEYSDQELSNWVFNTECLYNARNDQAELMRIINSSFIFTNKQLEVLKSDLEEEQEAPLYDYLCKDNDEELNQWKN